MLVSYGAEDFEKLRVSGLNGTLLPLTPEASYFLVMNPQRCESPWRDIVLGALKELGGNATLPEIYSAIAEHRRVRASKHWQAKVRQTLAQSCDRLRPGQFQLPLGVNPT